MHFVAASDSDKPKPAVCWDLSAQQLLDSKGLAIAPSSSGPLTHGLPSRNQMREPVLPADCV